MSQYHNRLDFEEHHGVEREATEALEVSRASKPTAKKKVRKSKVEAKGKSKNLEQRRRQVVLNNEHSRVAAKHKSLRKKKKKKSESRKKQTRLVSREEGYKGVKEQIMRIQVVPKDSLKMDEELSGLGGSNIYRRVHRKVQGTCKENRQDNHLYGPSKRNKSRRKKQGGKSTSQKKKSISRIKNEKKQIVFNISKHKIGSKLKHRRVEEMYKTKKNYFSTNSKGNADDTRQEENLFNLYGRGQLGVDEPPRNTESTLKNLDPLDDLRLSKDSKKIQKKMLNLKKQKIEVSRKKSKKKKVRSQFNSVQLESLDKYINNTLNGPELRLESALKNYKKSRAEVSRQEVSNTNSQLQSKFLDSIGVKPSPPTWIEKIQTKSKTRPNLAKAKSKIFYKKLAQIQFNFMNPSKLRTKEFSKIYADLKEIKDMPTYLGDLEFRAEINQMQILFGWHLLNRRLGNLGIWKTNRAFSFLNIKRFAEAEMRREKKKGKFQNVVLAQKLEAGSPKQFKIKKNESGKNFQKSRFRFNSSFRFHPECWAVEQEASELQENGENAGSLFASVSQEYFVYFAEVFFQKR